MEFLAFAVVLAMGMDDARSKVLDVGKSRLAPNFEWFPQEEVSMRQNRMATAAQVCSGSHLKQFQRQGLKTHPLKVTMGHSSFYYSV